MKRCKKITGWTDYPIEELGDKPGELAPVRHVTVLHYDGDKYIYVQTDCGEVTSFKAGYLYAKAGRMGEVPVVKQAKLGRGIYTYDPYAD